MKSIKSKNGKEIYMKQGIMADIAKKDRFNDENLANIKPVKPLSSQNACISYHDPPQIILYKAKPEPSPNVFKRITSDGKQRWINQLEDDK